MLSLLRLSVDYRGYIYIYIYIAGFRGSAPRMGSPRKKTENEMLLGLHDLVVCAIWASQHEFPLLRSPRNQACSMLFTMGPQIESPVNIACW